MSCGSVWSPLGTAIGRQVDRLGRSARKNHSIVDFMRKDEIAKRGKGEDDRENIRAGASIPKCNRDRGNKRRGQRIANITVLEDDLYCECCCNRQHSQSITENGVFEDSMRSDRCGANSEIRCPFTERFCSGLHDNISRQLIELAVARNLTTSASHCHFCFLPQKAH